MQQQTVLLEAWEQKAATVAARLHITAGHDPSRARRVCTAQIAVAKHTNRYWTGLTPDNAGTHVGANIVVHTGEDLTAPILLDDTNVGRARTVWVAVPAAPDEVHLAGWLPYDQAWQQAITGPDGRRYLDPRALLQDVPALVVTGRTNPLPADQMILTLTDQEFTLAEHVGTGRQGAHEQTRQPGSAHATRDAAYYDRKRMEDDARANVAGCVAELAIARFSNRYWPATVWTGQWTRNAQRFSDAGRNFEVRRVRNRRDETAVRRKQLGKGLILWAARVHEPDLRRVEVFGWIDHDQAWDLGTPADYDRDGNTRVVARTHFRSDLPLLRRAQSPAVLPAAA